MQSPTKPFVLFDRFPLFKRFIKTRVKWKTLNDESSDLKNCRRVLRETKEINSYAVYNQLIISLSSVATILAWLTHSNHVAATLPDEREKKSVLAACVRGRFFRDATQTHAPCNEPRGTCQSLWLPPQPNLIYNDRPCRSIFVLSAPSQPRTQSFSVLASFSGMVRAFLACRLYFSVQRNAAS